MNRRSSIIIAAGLVVALMAGTASRVATLHSSAAAPVQIVVQTAAPAAPAAAAPAPVNPERD